MIRITWLTVLTIMSVLTTHLLFLVVVISGIAVIMLEKLIATDIQAIAIDKPYAAQAELRKWNSTWWVTTCVLIYKLSSTIAIGYIYYICYITYNG